MLAKLLLPIFWYTDNKKIDKKQDKERIILQILRYGDTKQTAWLFKNYSRAIIKKVIINKGYLELDKKSFNYWCLILKINQAKVKKTRI